MDKHFHVLAKTISDNAAGTNHYFVKADDEAEAISLVKGCVEFDGQVQFTVKAAKVILNRATGSGGIGPDGPIAGSFKSVAVYSLS